LRCGVPSEPRIDVTQALEGLRRGDGGASERLWPLVYEELRQLAGRHMAGERRGQTLQPTALVHEAYIRLVGDEDSNFENRAHFFAAAATAMRRILIERARGKGRLKRGGDRERVELSQVSDRDDRDAVDLVALDAAMTKLEAFDQEKSSIVTLRYLLGCSLEETAGALGISTAKVRKDWTFTKAWLKRELGE
ncbi:MAG: ECF-type sigma factor, partial [Phycisphaerales bacterium]|nr:ECF-type sigma factor [Phycisphaerales bacterium]MCI0629325.1 ECF-type sigma factor [Phycisphaerales bacterium]